MLELSDVVMLWVTPALSRKSDVLHKHYVSRHVQGIDSPLQQIQAKLQRLLSDGKS